MKRAAEELSWRVHRLRRMTLAEVAFRVRRAIGAHWERLGWRWRRGPMPGLAAGTPPWIAIDADVPAAPYRQAADRILHGRFDVFELHDIELGQPPRWNRDPKTGIQARLQFGKLLDYRDERRVGEIKYLWEPNRHLHLVTLAQAYRVSGDPRYLEELGEQLGSWLDQCPCPYGPNWASSLEVAIRLVNWAISWQLIGSESCVLFASEKGAELRRRWLESVYQHSRFIAGYFSLHSSANNHLIGEASGLFIAATTWPFAGVAQRWSTAARAILEREVLLQNSSDGVHREQATWYQHFVLDFLLLASIAAAKNGAPFSDTYHERVKGLLEYLAAIMDRSGNVPMIGDADDGVVVQLAQPAPRAPYRALLCTGAVLFSSPEFKLKARECDDKLRWLLGEAAFHAFRDLPSATDATPRRRAFDEGGYYVLGCDFETASEVRIVADAGPLGYGASAGHGHADALAFTLSVGGVEFLIDPGTFCYRARDAWRRHLRSTRAHNTLAVDDTDQSVDGGNFLWLAKARAHCEKWQSCAEFDQLDAWHDGYLRLPDPVVHRRMLRFEKRPRRLRVEDTLTCKAPHDAVLYWHFPEPCQVQLRELHAEVRSGHARIRMVLPEATGARVEVLCGSERPIGGWVSRRFGERSPSPTLRWCARVEPNTRLITEIHCEKD